MKSNKFISVILSLAMLMSICGIQPIASAYDDTTTGMSTQRADVSYVYLGKSTPINETTKLGDFPGQTPKDIDTNLDVGEVVWIGVQMSNMTRVKDLLDRNSSDNNSGGLGTLCLGMAYDSEYLKPVGNASSLFNTSKIRSNYPTDAEFGAYYSMTMNSDLVWSERGSEENLLDNKSTTNDVIVQVRINDQSDAVANDGDGGRGLERMFEATSNDDPVVVAAFAFKILKKPTNGLKVLQAHLAGERFTIGVGYDGASPTTQWVNDRTSDASSNLKNYFDLTNANGGVIDIFPKTCSVNFYNDDTLTAPAVKTVSVAQGNTISTDDIPTDADFSPSTGMYFKELRYTTSTTANPTSDPVFDSNTTVTDDINVYAVYEAGHTVTFNSNYPSGTQTTKDVTVSPKAGATIAETQKPTIGTSSDDFEIPAGYTFDGWFTQQNGGDKIVFDDGTNTSSATDVSSITDVYAHWVQNVTVTFHENYGQTENTTNKTISAGSSLKSSDIPTFTRADYAFKEWNTKADGSGTTYSNTQLQAETISSNTDYYAMWTPENPDNAVTLTFSPTGCDAQVTPASMTVVRGDTIYAYQMPTPTKTSATGDAYTFNGWYGAASESDTTDKAPFTLTDNKTVYAHWTYAGRDQVTVTFDYDGATSPTAPTTITVGKGDSIGDAMPTTPVKTNYSFDKWVNTADNSDFDKTTTVNSDITVKAIYKSDITVNFNINDGTTPAAPFATDKGAPSKPYTAPSDPTRANYTFVGWNTKANGSGKFITAADYATLNDVSTAAGGTNPVELYAYWAAANVNPGENVIPDDIPKNNGVKVTFDSNVTGNKTNAAVTDANPKYVYPYLGDALGNMMPNEPTRTHYVFKGWNTKADGSGVTVDSTTKIDQATLKDALKEIAGTNTAYETTLYAQWDIDPSVPTSDKVNVTFNKNLDLKGNDTSPRVVTLYKGDSIGYDITEPTNGTFEFDGWKTAFDGTGTKFDKDTKIDADKTYYATWFKYLKVELVNANAEYTGQVISPKYNIYQIKYDDASKTTYTKVADSDIAKDATLPAGFTATVTDKDNATTTIQNVGVYTIAISIDNAGTYANGYKIGVQDSTFEVTSAKLTVNVDPDTQKQKAGSSRKDPVVTVVDATGNTVGKSEYDIKYYTWTDAGTAPDGNIQKSELSEVTDITKVGKYVVAVELKANSNYVIDSVKSTTTEAVLLYDGKTTGYAEYTDAKVGGNIVYEVLANDPSIKEIKANSVKGSTVDSTALPFKDSQYKNDVAFDNAETPAIKDYYVRVPDVDADSIQFNVTLTNPDTTTITASDGTTLTPTKNGDGTYTIKAPLTNKGQTENTITITTKAGTDNDAPTLTYTFHVQQLVEAKVELNPGNSPYGLIQRMATDVTDPWTATKIQQAKDAFNNSDATNKTYGAGLVPTNGQTTLKYTASAWEGQTKNYDTDVDAIFVYEAAQFTDPGLVVYDQTGAQIASPNVTKSLTLRKISTGVPKYTADEGTMVNVSEKLIDGVNKYDLSGAIYRPDVYELKYDIKYTDLTDGSTKHLNIIRPVIVLSKHGDVSLTTLPLLNANDASDLKNNWTTLTSRSNLFAFRTADVNITTVPLINSNDASDLKNKWTKGFDEFYTTLD